MLNTTLKYLRAVDKTCGKVLRLKVENDLIQQQKLKSHITKQLLTSISVDIRIYLPLKVLITFSGRYILMSTSLKSIIV